MRKIIFTFNYAVNYGAFLQCFALQSACENSVVADLIPSNLKDIRYAVGPYWRKKLPVLWFFAAIYRFFKSLYCYKVYGFKEKKMLHLLSDYKKNVDGDIAIVGSDQVWNPKMIEGREKVFFATYANFSKRVSYAASIGMKCWPDVFFDKIKESLKKFDYISVREASAEEYLKTMGFFNTKCVCDPTLFFKKDFYLKRFQSEIRLNDKFVFNYAIREKISYSFAPDSDIKSTIFIQMSKRKNIVSVADWLWYIDNSEYVLTDSFHCVVFCILFHKKFIVVKNHSRGKGMNERFSSLLGRTNLMYRCVGLDESAESVKERLFRHVDWNSVDCIVDEWRQNSLNWLKTALES